MKKFYLTLSLQKSTFVIQDLLVFLAFIFITIISPFFTWSGLRYDLFSSVVFFSFFNHIRFTLLWTTCLAFYIDTVMAMPIGSTMMLVLSMWFMNQMIQGFLKKRTFLIHWFSFSVIYLMVTVVKFSMLGFFLDLPCKILTELYSYSVTVFCYPLLCSIIADISRSLTLKRK